MKLKICATAIAGLLFAVPAIGQQPANPEAAIRNVMYGGVGPVISGSESYSRLPQKARELIETAFVAYGMPVTVEQEFADNTYEVEFAEGTEIEFNGKGDWTEVDAPGNRTIPISIVKSLLPERALKELLKKKQAENVETIKHSGKGYKVELREVEYDNLRFTGDGRLI